MNHCNVAAGLDVPEVQLTFTWSPIWYLDLPPVILGPSDGKAENKKKYI